jgi:uncharacterized protein (TIGR00369 family)
MSVSALVPPHFEKFKRHGPYAARVGPFYLRELETGGWHYALPLEDRHTNPTGITHGGALYGFADHMMGHNIVSTLNRMCATVKLKVEFMGASRPGQGSHLLMSADGTFKLGPEIGNLSSNHHPGTRGADDGADVEPAATPPGFKPYRTQGNFAALYGPLQYHRRDDGAFVCGFATGSEHDNSTGSVHGGAIFAFADDLLGRTVSASSKRYSATVCLDIQYLRPVLPGSWLSGQSEVLSMNDDYAQVRTDVMVGDDAVASAQGLWRLFDRYD